MHEDQYEYERRSWRNQVVNGKPELKECPENDRSGRLGEPAGVISAGLLIGSIRLGWNAELPFSVSQ